MTRAEIEREVMELVEEDFYGVWEIGWRLRSALGIDPAVDPEEAAGAVKSLREQQLVEIYVREWVDDSPQPIASSGRSINLYEPSAWLVPQPSEPQFLIGALDVGDVHDA